MFIPSFLNYRAAKINISIESSKENPKIIIRRYHYFKDRASRVQKESFSDLKVQSVASQCFHVLPRRCRFSSFSSKIDLANNRFSFVAKRGIEPHSVTV
jgi:hypothetical protein